MLNIFVQRVPDETGKGKFIRRLTTASVPLGVNYTTNPKGCVALLDVGWWHGPKKDIPRVIRMDGAEDYNQALMKNAVDTADAVIWQNNYCREYLGRTYNIKGKKKEFVICNGANPDDYKDTLKLFPGFNVIISGKWSKVVKDEGGKIVYAERENKRLGLMLDVASRVVTKNDDICFWVAGHTTLKPPVHERIKILGNVPDDLLSRYIAGSDVMLNLGKKDWCPNSVVECLVAEKPVIYSEDGGGIVELVGDCGFAVKDFGEDLIAELIRKKEEIYRPDLHIEFIASEYKKVFEEISKK